MNGLDSLKQFQALVSVSLHVSTEINLVEKAEWELPEFWVLAHETSVRTLLAS